MTARCNQQFVSSVVLHRLFTKITLTVLKPADHPLIDLFAGFEWSSMRAASDEKAQLILSAVKAEPTAGFVIDKPGPGRREIVAVGSQDEPGVRSRQFDKIGHIQSTGEKVGKTHFRVRIGACKQQPVG